MLLVATRDEKGYILWYICYGYFDLGIARQVNPGAPRMDLLGFETPLASPG